MTDEKDEQQWCTWLVQLVSNKCLSGFAACEQCFWRFAVQAENDLEDMRNQTAAQEEQSNREQVEAASRLQKLQTDAAEAEKKAAAAVHRLNEVSCPGLRSPQ